MKEKPFAELLRQLNRAHEEELQHATAELHKENASLRAQLQQVQRPPCERLAPSKSSDSSNVPLDPPEQRECPPLKGLAVSFADVAAFARSNQINELAVSASRNLKGEVSQASAEADPLKRRLRDEKKSDFRAAGLRATFRKYWPVAFEARDIVFQEICERKYPGEKWADLSSQQRAELLKDALRPQHFLVSPRSPFMKVWDMVIAAALIFCGVVTPYEVVFLHTSRSYWGLFVLNRLVDVLFIVDLLLQFFLKVEVQRPHRGGTLMLKDPKLLRVRYLKSWFAVDFLSIVPYDLIGWQITASPVVVEKAKILRCFKLLRTIKLLRMARSSRILQRWQRESNLQFATQKLLCFAVVPLLVSHWMACVWGFVGLTFGEELCEGGRLVGGGSDGVPVGQVSWVTTLYLGGKTSPDSPCHHFHIYVASLHWAAMTITSIGYGDIVPVRLEEYVVAIACMFLGGVLWAYVIGSLCSIISNRSPVESAYEANCDLLNYTMQEAQVPQEDRHIYREFLREAKSYDRRLGFTRVAEKLSPRLRRQLLFHVMRDSLERVYYFKSAPKEFVMSVASAVQPRFFSRGEVLDGLSHCLCVMDRGTVAHNGTLLVPPSVFHEDFIITHMKFRRVPRTVSLTFSQVLVLSKHAMEELLEPYPDFARTVRKYAIRLAFCRALRMTAEKCRLVRSRGNSKLQDIQRCMSLSVAFTATVDCEDCLRCEDREVSMHKASNGDAEEEKTVATRSVGGSKSWWGGQAVATL